MEFNDILIFLEENKSRFSESDYNLIKEKLVLAFDENLSLKKIKEIADNFFKKSDYENAIIFYAKYLAIEKSEMIFSNRAAALIQLNRLDEAIYDCESAIELNSLFLRPYFRLAKIYAGKNNFEMKKKFLHKILEIEPENEEAKKMLEEKEEEQKDLFNNVQEYMKNNPEMMKKAEEMARKMGFFK